MKDIPKQNAKPKATAKPYQRSKTILFFLLVFLMLGMSFYLGRNQNSSSTFAASQPQTWSQFPSSDLSFAVLGDVHDDVDHLQVALHDLHILNPKMDALILNGDTVDQGIPAQYDSITRMLLKNKPLLPPTIIKNIGNHEFFDYTIEENTPEDVQTFIQRYLRFAGEEKVYHDIWIKNYHFISLGSEDGNSKTNNSIKAYLSPTQLAWLKQKLAENYVKGKPIFVFLHQPLNSNSRNGWVGTDQGEELHRIFSAYPEVIFFTSHTHADLTKQSVLLNQPYTWVHTGAIHYTLVHRAQGQPGSREPYIKGLYVEVNRNNVVIKGRDFKEKTWIFTLDVNKA